MIVINLPIMSFRFSDETFTCDYFDSCCPRVDALQVGVPKTICFTLLDFSRTYASQSVCNSQRHFLPSGGKLFSFIITVITKPVHIDMGQELKKCQQYKR